ncbi:MAG: hypothetical protein JXB26_19735 [Candidatus Aminicenantes bacterium]|nr:hypothetical protein [Candidatus Aminicenantes bacterium]
MCINKTKKTLSIFFGLLLILVIFSCKQGNDVSDAVGSLVNYNGCKSFSSGSGNFQSYTQNQECLEYIAGNGILYLKHINAGFNCCPAEIFADVSFKNGEIIIEEHEAEQGCFCLCLFDLDYEIRGLEPGLYTVKIIGPYMNDVIFTCAINLFDSASGCFCIERDYYPWL